MKLSLSIEVAGFFILGLICSCSKNTNPSPPVHDTTVVVKTDTITVLPPPDSTVKLKQGLLLYLPFDGNIADSSGNGNPTMAIGGNVLASDAHGYANQAFGGTGNGERIKVTNNGSIKFDTAFSISLDFMQRVNSHQIFISMVNPSNAAGPSFLIGIASVGYSNLNFGVNDNLTGCDNFGIPDEPGTENDTTSFIPEPESWYNAICTYHKGLLQTYINGKLVSTKPARPDITIALLCPNAQIIIGGWWDGGPLSINGKLDEVRLYNRVLTPHEIVALSQHFQVTSEKTLPKLQSSKAGFQ